MMDASDSGAFVLEEFMDLKRALRLKEKYQTPIYLYDVEEIKEKIHTFRNYFRSSFFETEIIYASKAFSVKEMIRLVQKEGLSLDVVSLGELVTALSVGFDPKCIYFHGNNKSEEELLAALGNGVGHIVVDNLEELKMLEQKCLEKNQTVAVFLRLNVGVEAHTHHFIVTAHVDSKFGVGLDSSELEQMLAICRNSSHIRLDGFHTHIGSQIFDLTAFDAAMEKMVSVLSTFPTPLMLNLGGGFGVSYTEADRPVPLKEVCTHLIFTMEKLLREKNVSLRRFCIEPGRSIVGEAGSTLYTIGFSKQTPHKLYYFVDGGMTDNIRPALYQAQYHATVLGKEQNEKKQLVTIAGKCCESGDVLIENCLLPKASPGDLLWVHTTGAYGYSMSSNYNKQLIPAVVFIEGDEDYLVVRRQTLEELTEREI